MPVVTASTNCDHWGGSHADDGHDVNDLDEHVHDHEDDDDDVVDGASC